MIIELLQISQHGHNQPGIILIANNHFDQQFQIFLFLFQSPFLENSLDFAGLGRFCDV